MYSHTKQEPCHRQSKSLSQSKDLKTKPKLSNEKSNYIHLNPRQSSNISLAKSQGHYSQQPVHNGLNYHKFHHNKSNSVTTNYSNKHINSKKHANNHLNSSMQYNRSFSINQSLNASKIGNNLNITTMNVNLYKSNTLEKKNILNINTDFSNSHINNSGILTEMNYRPKQSGGFNFNTVKQTMLTGMLMNNNNKKELPMKLCPFNESTNNKSMSSFIDPNKVSLGNLFNSNNSTVNVNKSSIKMDTNSNLNFNSISSGNNNNNSNLSSINHNNSLNSEEFLLVMSNLENQFSLKMSQNPTNSKSRKYNAIKNIFEEFIQSIPLSNKKLLLKIISGYHDVVNAFANENRSLKEQNEQNLLKISSSEKQIIVLEKRLKEMEKESEQLKKKINEKTQEGNEGNNSSTKESLIITSNEINETKSILERKDNKYIQNLNKKNMAKDITDLDALYFFDKVKMNSDSKRKENTNSLDRVPKLDFELVDKISGKINKNVNINAINAGLDGSFNSSNNNICVKKKKIPVTNPKNNLFNFCKEAFK